MKTFNEAVAQNLDRLEQYVPVVAKVHGGHHPEIHEVRTLFIEVNKKIRQAEADAPDLEKEFLALRRITEEYTVPGDVCESYEAVYNMLEEIDRWYLHNK